MQPRLIHNIGYANIGKRSPSIDMPEQTVGSECSRLTKQTTMQLAGNNRLQTEFRPGNGADIGRETSAALWIRFTPDRIPSNDLMRPCD